MTARALPAPYFHASRHAPAGADEVLTGHQAQALARPPAGPITMIVTDFSTWTPASVTAVLADTADVAIGTAALKATTLGNGTGSTVKKLAGGPYNLTGKSLVLWLKVDSLTHLSAAQNFTISIGDTSLANFRTYRFTEPTDPDTPYLYPGSWWKFTIAWDSHQSQTGAPNRAAVTDIQFRAVDDAAGTFTFHVGGIGTIPEPATRFPNGVCSITFDDGFASQFTAGKPKLDQYSYPATAYVIKEAIDQAGRLTLAQLKTLQNQSGWEIASHAYTSAHHTNHFEGLSLAEVTEDLRLMKEWLAQNGLRGGDQFALPAGRWDLNTYDVSQRMFQSTRTTYARFETWPPADPQRLRPVMVSNGTTLATMQARIDLAVTSRMWLILCWHDLLSVPVGTSEFSITIFGQIIDYLNTKGIPVLTVGEVMRSVSG